VLALQASGADMCECDDAGVSALHVAARLGHADIIPPLIAMGVPVNGRDAAGQACLVL
jgi:ankyrin repeat protein